MLNICDMANEIEKYGENMLFMGDIKDTKIYVTLHIKKDGHWGTPVSSSQTSNTM